MYSFFRFESPLKRFFDFLKRFSLQESSMEIREALHEMLGNCTLSDDECFEILY